MQQTQSVHGHEVIELLCRDSQGLRARDLEAVVRQQFGDDPRFHTGSDEGMTLGQLLAFLIRKGKVYEQDGRLCVDRSRICREPKASRGEPSASAH